MKINKNFILKEFADKYILIPFGEGALDFNGIVSLNDTAKFFWENSQDNVDIDKLTGLAIEKYSVDEKSARESAELFVSQLKEVGCLYE